MDDDTVRIESELEVKSYLDNLRYALNNGARISFQEERKVDEKREERYTNRFTIADLFPDENPVDALKRELQMLTVEEYIQTVKDIRFPERSEMRVFGRTYNSAEDGYIKIRVELLSDDGYHTAFIMSFHYAAKPFTPDMFPYKRAQNDVQISMSEEKEDT